MSNTLLYIEDALRGKVSGDGEYTQKCSLWMQNKFESQKALLTTSGSHALEMAARLCDLKEGDEVIMPSYTFSSTANAFVCMGAKIVFIDIRPDTMNINESLIEEAITPRTRVIVPVHYAGVACEMDTITQLAKQYQLLTVEDAAQGVMAYYKGRSLGTLSNYGCFSFHETKNYSMGEGGALLIDDPSKIELAEIIREKGTDRSRFFRGQIDKYSWQDWGSSYLPSEINAAYLWSQLEYAIEINETRLALWDFYYRMLEPLQNKGMIRLPIVPASCAHNAHMFYIKAKNLAERTKLLEFLHKNEVSAVYHYVPLHSAPAGKRYGRFYGNDVSTTKESNALLRLPLYFSLSENEAEFVVRKIYSFYGEKI